MSCAFVRFRHQNEMLEKLQEKNKLWGLVLGRIVKAKVENEEIQDPVNERISLNAGVPNLFFTVCFR